MIEFRGFLQFDKRHIFTLRRNSKSLIASLVSELSEAFFENGNSPLPRDVGFGFLLGGISDGTDIQDVGEHKSCDPRDISSTRKKRQIPLSKSKGCPASKLSFVDRHVLIVDTRLLVLSLEEDFLVDHTASATCPSPFIPYFEGAKATGIIFVRLHQSEVEWKHFSFQASSARPLEPLNIPHLHRGK
jgi:hypothetical protein